MNAADVAGLRDIIWKNGFRPVPVFNCNTLNIKPENRGKQPAGVGWQLLARKDPPDAVSSFPSADALNTGILADGLRPIDIDIEEESFAVEVETEARRILGNAPVRRRKNSFRRTILYRAADGCPSKRTLAGKYGKVEVLGKGCQFVAFGCHQTGVNLFWEPEGPHVIRLDDLVAVTEEQLDEFLHAVASILGAEGNDIKILSNNTQEPSELGQLAVHQSDVGPTLMTIPNSGSANWDFWNTVGMAVWGASRGSVGGLIAWAEWSRQHPTFDEAALIERCAHFGKSPPGKIGMGKLVYLAQQADPTFILPSQRPSWLKPNGHDTTAEHRADGVAAVAAEADRGGRGADDSGDAGHAPDDGTGAARGDLPIIKVMAGTANIMATAAEAAIKQSDIAVFRRGNKWVRPVLDVVPASKGRKTAAAGLKDVMAAGMLDILLKTARWVKWNARKLAWVITDPPNEVGAIILSRWGEWTIPAVAGVVTTPTLRPDGTVLSEPGYDPDTRLYFMSDPNLVMPAMPEKPSRADAETALGDLLALLKNFPFVDEVSTAVALSGLITPVVRGSMDVAPLHAFRAPAAGTGKSFLVDLASAISTGQICPVTAAGAQPEEFEKKLTGLLLAGYPVVSVDNVNGDLGGDLLCQAVERPMVRLRRLGASDQHDVECRATMFATGNGLVIRGDMTRRTLLCLLDAGMERPELREFDFDPVQTVLADRGRYVAACLTVVRAYLAAGKPGVLRPLASYGEWSDLVRSALVWLGCSDPVSSMEAARTEDPEEVELYSLLSLWGTKWPGRGATVKDAIKLADQRRIDLQGYEREYLEPDLREALMRIAGERGVVNTRALGKWLGAKAGKVVGGMKFVKGETADGGLLRWRVSVLNDGKWTF